MVMVMEDSRYKIAAIEIDDPRCKELLHGIVIEMEDTRCKSLLYSVAIETVDPRCRLTATKLEDPRCGSLLRMW
jgi:hypothetical protein